MPNLKERDRQAIRGLAKTCVRTLILGFVIAFLLNAQTHRTQIIPFAIGSAMPFAIIMRSVGVWVLPRVRFRSFLGTILCRTLLGLIALFISFLLSFYAVALYGFSQSDMPPLGEILRMRPVWLGITTSFLVSLAVTFFLAINKKLGPGVMANWIRGRYFEPREEIRIFMFLDMKDSTTIAEKLGSIQFSRLVKEFFVDLTEPVLRTKAEVSHYIGDEAVITWTLENGIQNANCLRMFFLMREEIAKRTDFYQEKFGLVPEFKAGIHIGPVVATEVGEIKSEVVYHGDTLNTAARIQGLCNGLNEEFLVSGELQEALGASVEKYRFRHFGPQSLKGKVAEVVVSAVEAAPEETPKR